MADQNTRVERERIGTRIDEDITGLESREERDRVGSFADMDRAPSRPRVTPSKASTPIAAQQSRTHEIRAEIEQTREDLSETVNAIQDRLQPSTLASNAVDSVKDAARERFRDIADTETVQYVRANPMPTAMVGIGLAGLAWLAFGRETHDTPSRDWDGRRDWQVRSGYELERDRQLPGDQMDYELSARPRGAAREESRYLVQRTRQTARRAQSTLRRTWNDNPFIFGAAAAVVGALVAASVPATESENRLMGETRDNLVEGVQQAVKDKVHAVENAATNAVSQVQQAAGLKPSEESPQDDSRG